MISRLLGGLVSLNAAGLAVARGIVAQPTDPVSGVASELLSAEGLDPVSAYVVDAVKTAGPAPAAWTVAALEAAKGFGGGTGRKTPTLGGFSADLGVAPLWRSLPVALAYGADPAAVALVAGGQARLTHWSDEVEAATVLYCLVAAGLLEGVAPFDALAAGQARVASLYGSVEGLGLVEAAVACLSADFASTVQKTQPMKGYDPSDFGPLVSGLFGCQFGLEGFPPSLRSNETELRSLAERLLAVRESGQ